MLQNCQSKKVYERYPIYLDYLRSIESKHISSTIIAHTLGLGEVQVRKDLAMVSGKGRPKIGYVKKRLIKDIESYMGYNVLQSAIIIGFGKLGRALYDFKGFKPYGIKIVKVFDKAPEEPYVLPIHQLERFLKDTSINIAILTVPEDVAQTITDRLVASGIQGIWNFTTKRLQVPDHIIIQNENLATSLSILVKLTNEETRKS